MKTNISLIITTVNWQNGTFYSLSKEGNIWSPYSVELNETRQPIDLVRQLFGEITNLDMNWVNPVLRSATNKGDNLVLTYSCVIPLDTLITEGNTWIECGVVPQDAEGYEEMVASIRSIT